MNFKNITSIVLLVVAVTLQLRVFIHQFHQTADDNTFQFIALTQDWTYMFNFAHDTAQWQGRIGQYGSMALNFFSNYFIDHHLFRVFVLIIFAAFYVTFFLYVDLVLETKTHWVTSAIAIASVPLSGQYFPPNSYPLQITLPLFIILIIRLYTFSLNWEIKNHRNIILMTRLILFALLFSLEYIFIFFGILVISELFIRSNFISFLHKKDAQNWSFYTSRLLLSFVKFPTILIDVIILSIALSVHVLFQAVTPAPPYDGITFGSFNIQQIATVQFWHTLGSFSILHLRLDEIATGEKNWTNILNAFVTGIFIGIVVWINWEKSRPKQPWLLLIYGLCWCFLITLPFGLSAKYQHWCLNGPCYYLDSRLAFLGLCLVIVGATYCFDKLFLLLTHKNVFKYISLVLVMILTVVTNLSNLENQKIMYEKQKPFDQIKAYSCLYPNQSPNDKQLVNSLSNDKNILWYEGDWQKRKPTYVSLYLEKSRKMNKDCNALYKHLDTNFFTP